MILTVAPVFNEMSFECGFVLTAMHAPTEKWLFVWHHTVFSLAMEKIFIVRGMVLQLATTWCQVEGLKYGEKVSVVLQSTKYIRPLANFIAFVPKHT